MVIVIDGEDKYSTTAHYIHAIQNHYTTIVLSRNLFLRLFTRCTKNKI